MHKKTLNKLMIIVFILLMLSGCNGGFVDFHKQANAIAPDIPGYTIVSKDNMKINDKIIDFDEIIVGALKDKDIKVSGSHYRISETYRNKRLAFVYRASCADNAPYMCNFVLGILNIESLEVSIIRQYEADASSDLFRVLYQFDDNYVLIKNRNSYEYIDINTLSLVTRFDVSPLVSRGIDMPFAYIDDGLKVVEFNGSEITEVTYQIPDMSFSIIKDNYLLSTSSNTAYDYIKGEFADYDTVSQGDFYIDEITYDITFMGQTFAYDAFMNQTDTLRQLNVYAKESDIIFNQAAFTTNDSGQFLILSAFYGGIDIMTSYTQTYIFKYENNTFYYIGYTIYFRDAYLN